MNGPCAHADLDRRRIESDTLFLLERIGTLLAASRSWLLIDVPMSPV
jgi:hypothetical protein